MKGALWTHRLAGTPLQVRCTAGSVWLTREGDPGDVVLQAGTSYGGAGRGLLVVEALEEAQIAVTMSGKLEALREGLRALGQRVSGLRVRGSLGQQRMSVSGVRSVLGARWLVPLSLAAVYVIWGSTYLAMRVGLETFPPFLMAGSRFLTAGALLYGALRLGGRPAPTAREWGAAVRTGVPLLVIGNGMVAIGQQWVSSGVAAVIVSTMPLWLALFASTAAYTARRAGRADGGAELSAPSRGEWVGLFVGFCGAALLHLGGQVHAARTGMLLILLAPVSWALGSLWSRSLPLPAGPMATACQMLVGGSSMLILSPVLGEHLRAMPSGRSLFAVAYLIVFGSIVAFSAYGFLIRNTRPAIATSYAYVNPLVAIALGIWLGGEEASATTWLSSLIVVAGVIILSRARAQGAARRAA